MLIYTRDKDRSQWHCRDTDSGFSYCHVNLDILGFIVSSAKSRATRQRVSFPVTEGQKRQNLLDLMVLKACPEG